MTEGLWLLAKSDFRFSILEKIASRLDYLMLVRGAMIKSILEPAWNSEPGVAGGGGVGVDHEGGG